MVAFVLLLASDPPWWDLQRFPRYSVASLQSQLYYEHEQRLIFIQRVRGWEDGQWQVALEYNAFGHDYWQLLYQTRKDEWVGPVYVSSKLREMRTLIGWQAYSLGWHPPLYDDIPADCVTWQGELFLYPINLPPAPLVVEPEAEPDD